MPETVEELEVPEFSEEELDEYFEESQELFEELLIRVSSGSSSWSYLGYFEPVQGEGIVES
ncbi:MAG: hypothetical protein SVS85_01535 [Candidatus Nanohaloarchaea archaeon]|nr:hypothetical protein [Candidatus Nanohaloarchaea archaeon]